MLANLRLLFSLFADRLEQLLSTLADGQGAALLYLDLDGFKHISDRLGHETGDQLQQAVAGRLSACSGRQALAARLGGGEFAVLLPSAPEAEAVVQAEAAARQILTALRGPLVVGSEHPPVTASIGIAVAPRHGRDPVTLLRHADGTMYSAKIAVRDTYRAYAPATHDEARQTG